MFGNLKDQLKEAQLELKNRLEKEKSTGEAAEGKVKIVVNGNRKLLSVHIDPALYEEQKADAMEALIMEAANKALNKAEIIAEDEMINSAKDMLPPGLL